MHLEACPGPGEKVLQHKLIQNMRRIFLAFDLAWDNISANDLSDNVLMKYSYSLRSDLHRLCLSRLGQIMPNHGNSWVPGPRQKRPFVFREVKFLPKQAKEVNFDPYIERSILGLEIYGLDQIKDKLL